MWKSTQNPKLKKEKKKKKQKDKWRGRAEKDKIISDTSHSIMEVRWKDRMAHIHSWAHSKSSMSTSWDFTAWGSPSVSN